MFTLSLLASRSVRVFFDPNATKALPENTKVNDTRNSLKALAATVALAAASVVLAQPQTTQVAMNTQNSTPTTSVKGAGIGQYASNGQEFVKLAALSADEMGKLPVKIQTELEAWMDNQEGLKKQVVASLDQGITEQGRLISQKWKEYSITLQQVPIKQVAQYFRTSVPEGKKFLEYVVKNDLPPPGFAQKILDTMNNA